MRKTDLFRAIIVLIVILSVACISPIAKAEEKVVKIGVVGPMKFMAGMGVWAACQIAAEEINAAGGIMVKNEKYKIELFEADSNEYLSVPDAVSAAEKLITVNKVNALVGAFRSEAALAQQEVTGDNKVLFLGVQAAHPKLCERVKENYDRYKYFFRFGALNSVYLGEVGYAYVGLVNSALKEKLRIEKPRAAIQYEKAVWADPIVKIAEERLPKLGFEVVRTGRHSATATDLTSELTAIKAAGAHLMFTGGAGPASHTLAKQWGELQIPAALVSISTPSGEKQHWEATGGGCNYEVMLCPMGRVSASAKTIPFYDKFVKRANDYPTSGGQMAAYDAVYILKDSIERSGALNSDAIVAAMEKTDYMGALGRFAFHPLDHKWPHDVIWGSKNITYSGGQWQNGNLEIVWPDGRPLWGDESWKGVRFKGTVDYKLPPAVLNYWKGKK